MEEYGLSQIQYNLLYAVYGYVNFIAPLLAGLLVDWIGINSSTLIFQLLIVIGHTLWIIACFDSVNSFILMIIGRAIFGVGAEQFHLSRKWILFEYFTGTEYYFASGLSLSASRLGSASQSYISAYLYDKTGSIPAVLSIGWILTIFSLILLIIFLILQKRYHNNQNNKTLKNGSTLSNLSAQNLKQKNIKNEIESDDDDDNNNDEEDAEYESIIETKFHLISLCRGGYDRRWWYLGLTLIFFYSTYLSYSNVGSAFLQNRYKYKYEEANSLAPITFWIAAIATPIFGFICDYYGKRCIIMLFAGICLLFGHLFLGFIGSSDKSIVIPIFGLIFLGFGYSLGAAAIWPSFGLIVKQKYLASTLGVWGSIDNMFQACCFVIIGALTKEYDKEEKLIYTDQYNDCRWFWIILALGTIFWTLMLWYSDAKQFDNILWLPEAKFRKEIKNDSDMANAKSTEKKSTDCEVAYSQVVVDGED